MVAIRNGGPRVGTTTSRHTRSRQAGIKFPGAGKPLFGVSKPNKGVGGQRPLSQSIKNGQPRSTTKRTPRTRRP